MSEQSQQQQQPNKPTQEPVPLGTNLPREGTTLGLPLKHAVNELVPNSADGAISELAVIEGQRAVMERDRAEAEALKAETAALKAKVEFLEAEHTRKRKHEEEEEQSKRRRVFDENSAKMQSVINQTLEEMRVKSDGMLSDAEVEEQRERLIGMTKTEAGHAQLIANEAGLLALAHRACLGAAAQRDQQRKQLLREQWNYTQQRLAEPPSQPFTVSGGHVQQQSFMQVDEPLSFYSGNAGGGSAEEQRVDALGKQIAKDGTVRASFNAFENAFGLNKHTVSERVGGNPTATKQQNEVAAPGVNLHAENWADQVVTDFMSHTNCIPSEDMLRHGGLEAKTRFVANANGGQQKQTTFERRLSQPIRGRGRITMQHLDPEGFKQIVEGVRAGCSFHGRVDQGAIRSAERCGERDENGKFKNWEPYRGPVKEDNLKFTELY